VTILTNVAEEKLIVSEILNSRLSSSENGSKVNKGVIRRC